MKLQQLRFLCGIADHSLNLSKAADALFTSQPGISRQVKLLEDELGVELLVREGNRIAALTEPGRNAVEIARRVMRDIDNLRSVGSDYANEDSGSLVVATTYVHARYALLPVVTQFQRRFPNVNLSLRETNPDQIVELVSAGTADIGLCSSPTISVPRLVGLPCFRDTRCVLVPHRHPLLRKKRISLADLAAYPMITLDHSFSGGIPIIAAFQARGIEPHVVLSASNADVIKAYVAAGTGIATLPDIAFDAKRDRGLRTIPAQHLFQPSTSFIWLHRHRYLRHYVSEFIQMLSSTWTRPMVDRYMRSDDKPSLALAFRPAFGTA
jgi:LysR family cys regulon transcriptional activator